MSSVTPFGGGQEEKPDQVQQSIETGRQKAIEKQREVQGRTSEFKVATGGADKKINEDTKFNPSQSMDELARQEPEVAKTIQEAVVATLGEKLRSTLQKSEERLRKIRKEQEARQKGG